MHDLLIIAAVIALPALAAIACLTLGRAVHVRELKTLRRDAARLVRTLPEAVASRGRGAGG